MKKLLIVPLLMLCVSMFGQYETWYETFTMDTITDAGTVTFTMSKTIDDIGYYGFYAVSDSLSGSTDATVSYQVADRGGADWAQVGTGTVNGVISYQTKEAILYGQKFRAVFTGTGTQSTKVRGFFVFKKGL